MTQAPQHGTPHLTAAGAAVGRVRFLVLAWLCSLAAILYLDRVCISAALPAIQRDLRLSNTEVSYVLMAFTLAYGLFEIPTGHWGDILGARRVLTRISLWWSAFTIITGACSSLWMLIPVRFLFGAGEAGAFPNAARVVSRWFPGHERGRVQGILLAASQTGGAIAPFLAALLIQAVGWRATFAVFGAIGFFWALGFYLWFRDEPLEHPAVTPAEALYISEGSPTLPPAAPIPWSQVLRNPGILLLSAIMICASFNSYIYFSWFPKYLQEARRVAQTEAGLMSSVVLSFAAIGTFTGGWLVDALNITVSIGRRRAFGAICFLIAMLLLILALRSTDSWQAVLLTAGSCFATQATQSLWWSCSIGISGQHVGALFGLMNSMGVFGAIASQYLAGALADWLGTQGFTGRDQWDPIFRINCGVLATAAVLWSVVVLRKIESETPFPGTSSLQPRNPKTRP
jgi:MFS family permease